MGYARRSGSGVLVIAAAASASACERGGGPVMRFLVSTPHERYEAQLRQIGLDGTALGRDWLTAADRSLGSPVDVDVPHREARYLDPARATAVVYRIPMHQGQRVFARINAAHTPPDRFRLFLDLFLLADSGGTPRLVASADSAAWELDYVALKAGAYLLRVQPELLRGGRITLTVSVGASLGFPVERHDVAAIRSRFGVPRDAGRRRHEGVDIFAPRGTPVIASIPGRVSRVMTNRLGGKIVWLFDQESGRWLYYAHLDRHAVGPDAWVRAGDTLGFVGNSGNARTTPPHLHFGIYLSGAGAVDPFYYLYDAKREPPALGDDAGLVPRWARVAGLGAVVRTRPSVRAPAAMDVAAFTPLEVLAVTGEWLSVRLPDGSHGYVDRLFTESLAPAGVARLAAASPLFAAPDGLSDALDELAPDRTVWVLGRHQNFVMVRDANGLRGWVAAPALLAVDVPPAAGGGGAAIAALAPAPRP